MTDFILTFNLDFTPCTWNSELEDEFGIILNKSSDIRPHFSFLYATEEVLLDILEETTSSWGLDNILINKTNYSISITKGAHNSTLKLTLTKNQINLLEQKIAKQSIQLNDPFHWTKNIKNKSTSDIGFLNIFYKSIKSPIDNIESIMQNRVSSTDEEFKKLDHELKILKDLMIMTENYLKQRIEKK